MGVQSEDSHSELDGDLEDDEEEEDDSSDVQKE